MGSVGRIGFIGGGRIAHAMAKGFIKAGKSFVHLIAGFDLNGFIVS